MKNEKEFAEEDYNKAENHQADNEEQVHNQPEYQRTLRFHADTISQVVFNPNNKQIISSSYDNSILLWDLTSNSATSKPKKLSGHKSLINDLAVSPSGVLIASASSDETVRIWRNMTGEENESQLLKHNSAPVKSVDFSCDSRLIVTGSDDKTVKIISIGDRKIVANLTSHSNWVKCVRFSQDAKLIASTSDDKTVKLWDVNKRALTHTFSGVHNGVVNAVRFHPDNSLIGTACYDKKVRLFDVRSKQLVQVYENHKKPVTSLAFHPSGNFMASTSYDETVKIFDLRKGEVMFTLNGHEGATTCVNFSKYGNYFATGAIDAVILLWESNLDYYTQERCEYYNFPMDNDSNPFPQSSSNLAEGNLGGGNSNYIISNMNSNISSNVGSNSKENISEDLSKVFEKMVHQLEIITNTFQNFESRLTRLEDMMDDLKNESAVNENEIEYFNQKKQIEKEFMSQLDNARGKTFSNSRISNDLNYANEGGNENFGNY